MPLSTSEKAALVNATDALALQVAALVVDPDPHPLQVQLDAAVAARDAVTAERDQARAQVAAMETKVANAKAALQASISADAAEDAARNAALQALD